MPTNLDTHAAALRVERTLVLQRTERRTLLVGAATPSRATRLAPQARAIAARWGRLLHAVRALRRGTRPALAER
jgi:hypothetical protein